MSCCPPAPEITASTFNVDPPQAGREVTRLPGEPEECFQKRRGNVSDTGRVDDKTEEDPGRIAQNVVATDCNAAINQTFSLTGSVTATSWQFIPSTFPGSPGVTCDTGLGRVQGTFSDADVGKRLTLRVKALVGATVVDDRTYSFSPTKCGEGETIRLTHPLPGSVLTSRFGPRKAPTSGASSEHGGADFAYADKSTRDVLCAADGVVVCATTQRGYGNIVMVKHTSASGKHLVTTAYAHLDKMYVSAGQKVAMGQAVGKEGNTGIGTGAHLHFEVRLPNGARVDPIPYLKGETPAANKVSPDNQPVQAEGTVALPGGKPITKEQVDAGLGCKEVGSSDYEGDDPPPPAAPPPYDEQEAFEKAWLNVCRGEVSPSWATSDATSPTMIRPSGNPEIDQGLIATGTQRQRVGYVNSATDPGGETKFGVAQRHNPKISVKALQYTSARQLAYDQYWLASQRPCTGLSAGIATFVFDCNYFFGPAGSASVFNAAGISGNETGADERDAIDRLLAAGIARIKTRSADLQRIYGRGWTNRLNKTAAYAKTLV